MKCSQKEWAVTNRGLRFGTREIRRQFQSCRKATQPYRSRKAKVHKLNVRGPCGCESTGSRIEQMIELESLILAQSER